MHFNFVASDHFNLNVLSNIENFIDNFPDFQTVELSNDAELSLLLDLMGITNSLCFPINNADFNQYWDISNSKFPELDQQAFESFYKAWIQKSDRENNMDEFGSLIFLQGLSQKWNQLKYRLVIKSAN